MKIYDNGGKTIDRYTVILEDWHFGKSCQALGLSSNPDSPQGFSQFSDVYQGNHLGKEIGFLDLPENVQEHITMRINETSQQML